MFKRLFQTLKILILGTQEYKKEIIYFYELDKRNDFISNMLLEPKISYEYVTTHIHNYYLIELEHKLINTSYILSKIDKYKEICSLEIHLTKNNFNRINFNDINKEIAIYENRINFYLEEVKKLFNSKEQFNEKYDFENKNEIISFFEFIKNEIKNDIKNLKEQK